MTVYIYNGQNNKVIQTEFGAVTDANYIMCLYIVTNANADAKQDWNRYNSAESWELIYVINTWARAFVFIPDNENARIRVKYIHS